MPYFISGEYLYFKDNEEVPKIHHIVCILNQKYDFDITSPLHIVIITKTIVLKFLSSELRTISKLFLIYQKLTYPITIVFLYIGSEDKNIF